MNPLDWLPSAEVLGNAWNIYSIICLLAVFVVGVCSTKHTKKPLLYRIVLSFLVAWCLQLIFIETVSMVINAIIFSILGTYNIASLSWILHIGIFPVEVRPLYTLLPFFFLGYFAFIDKKSVASERMFNWNPKWILLLIFVMTFASIMTVLLGYTLPHISYPLGSAPRYVTYYGHYVTSYTAYAILGIKLYSKRWVKMQ